MRISEICNALFLQREEAHFWGSIDNTGNTGVRSKQEQTQSWNGRWKIYVDPIDSWSAVSLVGRLRLRSATLWSTSQRIPVSVDGVGFLNLTLKWINFFWCCYCLLNRSKNYDLGCFFPPFYLKFLLVSCATLHTEEILDKTSCWIPIFLLYI